MSVTFLLVYGKKSNIESLIGTKHRINTSSKRNHIQQQTMHKKKIEKKNCNDTPLVSQEKRNK